MPTTTFPSPMLRTALAPSVAAVAPSCAAPAPAQALAFIDVETTGLDPAQHDIVELAVVRVDARTLEVLAEHHTRITPERLAAAEPEALALCGFSPRAWARAVPLRDALHAVVPLCEHATLAGHNVAFDASFLAAAFERTGLPHPVVHHRRIDTEILAWPLLACGAVESLSLDALAQYFGLRRPMPHRALADAYCSLEIARRLVERVTLGGQLLEGGVRRMVRS